MKLFKISSISFLVLLSFVVGSYVSAEEAVPKTKTIVLATMNAQNAKIVSQEGNNINISFNISNREGAQSGVRYSVKLVEKVGAKQVVVDEYVYPEVLSVSENTTITKDIVYEAPKYLGGVYYITISLRNYSGLPLGATTIGPVLLEGGLDTVKILPETCTLSLSSNKEASLKLSERVKVATDDNMFVTCTIENNTKEEAISLPVFETYYGSVYGDMMDQQGGDISPVLLKAGEKKAVEFTLPKVAVPQSYVTKFYLNTGEVFSNYVLVNYTLSGLSATIQNFSLDKTSYKANDTAKISFFWTSSVTKKEDLPTISISANIVNQRQKACTNPVEEQLAGVGFIEIPVSITRDCENPKVAIVLKDASGNILDEKTLDFEESDKIGQNIFAGKYGIIILVILGVLVILGGICYFRRKGDDDTSGPGKTDADSGKSGHIEGTMLAILFILGVMFAPAGLAKADTYYISMTGVDGNYVSDPYYGVMVLSTNVDQSSYPTGTPMYLNSYVYYAGPTTACSNVFLDAYTNYENQNVDFSGDTIICGGEEETASNQYIQSTSSAGNFEVTIYGDVYLRGTQAVYVTVPVPYTVVASTTPSVTVYAKNTANQVESTDSITVNAGLANVEISWSSINSTKCTCTYNGGNCTPSSPTAREFPRVYAQGSPFSLTSTSTFTVSCLP